MMKYNVTRQAMQEGYVGRERTVVVTAKIDQEREVRQVLLAFANSIQERDIVTYEHSRRVAMYAQRLARYLGWNRRDARDLALAALVHDILLKSAALSDEERRTMERHPVIGARILIGCDVHPFYVETVLYHHEAWDGHGYPTGLKGEEIPLSARILTVADVFDVLTSQRPYKAPLSLDAARERLLLGSGASFDPQIVRAFLQLLDLRPDFTLPQRLCAISVDMDTLAQENKLYDQRDMFSARNGA
jgi:putative nucleotidyltransferase with HDIG domain